MSTILVGVMLAAPVGCSSGQPSVPAVAPTEEAEDEQLLSLHDGVVSNDETGEDAALLPDAEPPEAPSTQAVEIVPAEIEEAVTGPIYSEEAMVIRRHFLEMRPDPIPAELVHETHYWVSNENAHYVWHEMIDGLGGVLAGVGTDQVYMMAAWANADIIVPLDFDQQVVNIHYVYGALLQSANTPAEFLAYWFDRAEDDVRRRLREFFPERHQIAEPMNAWRHGHRRVKRRLERIRDQYEETSIGSFMSDQSQFEYVRDRWRDGLVFPIRGDLTANTTMRDLGIACESAGVPLRVLYLSNAEQYFEYTPEFRRNIIAQHFDERSVVLRTRPMVSMGTPQQGGEYHYNYQGGRNFAAWLQGSRVRNGRELLIRHRHRTRVEGLSVVNDEPPTTRHLPEVADP